MHWGAISGVGALAAAATAVVATNSDSRSYPLPLAVAQEKLAAAPLPEALAAMGGHQISLIREDDGLRWRLGPADRRSEGRVELAREGATTRVRLDFDLSEEALGSSHLSGTRLTQTLAESMFEEHVDAVLAGRRFDSQAMMRGAAAELQADPEMLKHYGNAVRQDMLDVASHLKANSKSEPPPPDPRAATRPTLILTSKE